MRDQVDSSSGSCRRRHEEPKYCCDGSSPDDIVITGIAGRFPLSDDVDEFRDHLYNMDELIIPTEERWKKGVLCLPYSEAGILRDIDKFDNEFFGIPGCIAKNLEPEQRMLLEVCYEAIADSGYDPQELRGRPISVYNASSNKDGKEIFFRDGDFDVYSGIGYLNCLRANRCAHLLDFRGPSFVVDAACSSSACAMDIAIRDLKSGRCEAAVISGSQITLNPEMNAGYLISGILTKTGLCRPFDSQADGMARSEAITAVFIQKASAARRIYATIISDHLLSAGYVPEGVYVPSAEAEIRLFRKTLDEAKTDPLEISYVEAHGTGTLAGDPAEIKAINAVFCENRKKPLYIGTVKSNMGHPEAPAGICGIIKSVMAFESGVIAPNLHYTTPNSLCQPLIDGTIKIVTEPTPLEGSMIAVNCFGFGGAISQMILRKNRRELEEDKTGRIPQLALYSATAEDAVRYAFNKLLKVKPNQEFFSLFLRLAASSPKYKPYRGYLVLNNEQASEIKHVPEQKRAVWFIVTGMGCQWPGMACDLMQIKVFADSMLNSAKVLKPHGIDLLELIKADKDYLLQNRRILPAFVAICAIQIALIDVLRELEIVPDGIIGHSTGELACAYADGCCTAEETILSAYWRGKAVESANLVAGEMAAVGLSWEEAKKKCPENVYPSCNNASDSVTISGLKKPLEDFVAQLKQENVFARIVNAYGYGFHSKLVHPAASALKESMEKLITNPKPRTKRWLSTSYPPEEWDKPEAQIADANYFTHNLMSTVHFAEALKYVPSDAVTIEIGPHFLLQALLKRSIGTDAKFIGLMKRNENNINYLLSSIGKLYTLGLNPKIENLYPPVSYPVPRGTPCLSSFIRWNHSVSWKVVKYIKERGGVLHKFVRPSETDAYLLDHCIEGRALFPATGYIFLLWETLSKVFDKMLPELSIVIDEFKIHRATILGPDAKTFVISISTVEGTFEVAENGTVVASGKATHDPKLMLNMPEHPPRDAATMVSGSDLYSELKIHGYEYGPAFQCLDEMSTDGKSGYVRWGNKWIPYLDAHLLFFGLLDKCQQFCLPTGALSIKINPMQTMAYIDQQKGDESNRLPVIYNRNTKICYSPGVEIQGLKLEAAPRRQVAESLPILEKCDFVPYLNPCSIADDVKEECLKYIDACNEMAKKIALSFGRVPNGRDCVEHNSIIVSTGKFDAYLKSESDEFILFKTLQKISELPQGQESMKDLDNFFSSYVANVGKEMLYKTLLDEQHLRVALEIIFENISSRASVVEFSNGLGPILPSVLDVTRVFSRIKLQRMFVHPDPKSLDQNVFSQRNIELKAKGAEGEVKDKDLVISSFLFGNKSSLKSHLHELSLMSTKNGFVLLFHRECLVPAEAFLSSLCNKKLETTSSTVIESIFKEENLDVVSKFSDSLGNTLYLLRSDKQETAYKDSVVRIKDGCYSDWVEEIKSAMTAASDVSEARLWLVAEDSPYNGLIGMMKCLCQEPGGEKVRCLFITKDESSRKNAPPFDLSNQFYSDILKKNLLFNVYQKGVWGSFRHIPLHHGIKERKVEHSFMNITKYGDLSSFKWFESPYKYELDRHGKPQTFVHVVYSALNFKDVMYATAKMSSGLARDEVGSDPCVLGLEFSGITADGRRVMGACLNRAIATTIHRPPMFMLDVPDHWTLEDACTVPVVYSTCYYALIVRGQLARGESVLIHSGTGGIGIAAIRIAQSLGCEIFTTVGTDEKRQYLKKLFPSIKDENIGCSRNTSFEFMVKEQTSGRGVDVILNSLADDKLQASTRCLAKHGRFVEIGKYDLALDHKIGLGIFLDGTSFHGVFLDKIGSYCDSHGARIQELMYDGLRKGVVQPLDRTVFPSSDVEKAFRFMGSGKHMGKVLLKIRDEPPYGVVPVPLEYSAHPCVYFYKYKVYIVIGGLGGFGVQLTQWLADKGARNIILTSRYGVRTAYHNLCISRWKDAGINVTVSLLNAGKREEAEQLLLEASKTGPVGGIFNSAVVLKDAFMENQNAENFEEVCLPKAAAAKHLDELSRRLCPSLDHFVCFSSISCGKGNAGQTSYGYANSVMERVCEKRRHDGLHGLAIQWGIIGDVGVVHRQMGEDAMIAGVMAQRIKSCLETLEQFLLQDNPVVTSYVTADALKKKVKRDDLLTQLAKILGHKDASELNMTRSFQEMGIDSMVGVEIQHALEMHYDITLSIKELRDMKISDLKDLIDAKGGKKPQGVDKLKCLETLALEKPTNLIPEATIMQLNSQSSGFPIVFVHYSEDAVAKLQNVIAQLQNPCFGIVCSKEAPVENIEALSEFCLKAISEQSNQPVHLVGYGPAICLAYEMATVAQGSSNFPRISSLTFLDGIQELANSVSNEPDFSNVCQNDLQDIEDFMGQFLDIDLAMPRDLLKLKYPHEGIGCVCEVFKLLWKTEISKAEVLEAAKRYLKIRNLMRNYRPKEKYVSDITIIEATEKLLANDVAFVKTEISKICSGKVTIHRVPGKDFISEKQPARNAADLLKKSLHSSTHGTSK